MRKMILIATGLASMLPTMPALAGGQSYYDQRDNGYYDRGYDNDDSYGQARERYEADRQRYEAERDSYYRNQNGYYNNSNNTYNNGYGYNNDRARGYYDRNGNWRSYDRDDNRYAYNGQTWRGRDGRYYCRRSDGTTGLLIGGVAGALLGNAIDGGRNRAAGTIIGGGAGALLGREVDRDSQPYCR